MKKFHKKAFIIRIAKLIIFLVIIVFFIFMIKNDWNVKDAINNMLSFL